jgi:hypothetical protein
VRHRLRDFIVLALRTAAVLLVALAIARPKLGDEPLVSDSQTGSAIRVVILDVSQSMAELHHGVEAIERARTITAEHLRYRPGLRVNLILAGASPFLFRITTGRILVYGLTLNARRPAAHIGL